MGVLRADEDGILHTARVGGPLGARVDQLPDTDLVIDADGIRPDGTLLPAYGPDFPGR
ncbi:MAG: hypothetical protein ACFB21_15725 [Opitutales bacterium]